MEKDLLLQNFANASNNAIEGAVSKWMLLIGLYGALTTIASVLDARGALTMP